MAATIKIPATPKRHRRQTTSYHTSQRTNASASPERREWGRLLEAYPAKLRQLRTYQIGGFWCSRSAQFLRREEKPAAHTTCAFYRQFCLTDLIHCEAPERNFIRFERAIVESVQESLNSDSSAQTVLSDDLRSRVTNLVQAVIGVACDESISGGTPDGQERAFRSIYTAYDHTIKLLA